MTDQKVLGIDLGGTHLRLGLVDEQGQVTNFTILNTREVLTGDRPVDQLLAAIETYCTTHGRPRAVSIGFPSTIDRQRRTVVQTPNIRGLDNVPVADLLEATLGVPAYVNRDVNFLMLYDLKANQLEAEPIVLGFYVGTGFGNAVALNGRLLLGKHGMAAELGHTPLYEVEDICGCGNPGCVETRASGIRLEQLQREHFADTPLTELFMKHGDHPVLMQFLDNLSLPIATEVTIFDPDCIILGGGIFQMPGFPEVAFEEALLRHVRKPYPGLDYKILYSAPQQENGVIGAGLYGFKRLQDPSYL